MFLKKLAIILLLFVLAGCVQQPEEITIPDSTEPIFIEIKGGGPTDLRGSSPQSAGVGGVGASQVEFADNVFRVFDESDVTKIMAFDAGTNVTTGNTRTLQIPDASGILALTAQTDGTINASDITAGTFGGSTTYTFPADLIVGIIHINPQATAPGTCTIGDFYVDTSGAYCGCSSANTWENMLGTGTCS